MRELHQPLSEIRKMTVREVMQHIIIIDERAKIIKEQSENARR